MRSGATAGVAVALCARHPEAEGRAAAICVHSLSLADLAVLLAAGTDRLVEMVRQAGPAAGLFGAKITGGGSGGTVAVLGRADAAPSVAAIARSYRDETGQGGYVFTGSSPGACSLHVDGV